MSDKLITTVLEISLSPKLTDQCIRESTQVHTVVWQVRLSE